MVQFRLFLSEAGVLFSNLFFHPDLRTFFDIIITAIIIYQILRLALHTRASSVFKGIAFVTAIAWIADMLQLNTLNWIIRQVLNTGVICLVILFQPELRNALEHLGRSNIARSLLMNSSHKRQLSAMTEQHVTEIINSLQAMSKKRIGALIVFEGRTGLKDMMNSGTECDAAISSALIQNIFEPNTPLHDGAVIIRNERIVSAGNFMNQLTLDKTVTQTLGTRHRAAIGITEGTDAISLIVSEETGVISCARSGKLTRYVDEPALRSLLTEIFDNQFTTIDLIKELRESMFEKEENDV